MRRGWPSARRAGRPPAGLPRRRVHSPFLALGPKRGPRPVALPSGKTKIDFGVPSESPPRLAALAARAWRHNGTRARRRLNRGREAAARGSQVLTRKLPTGSRMRSAGSRAVYKNEASAY
jgi:hypothetical protein